MLSDEDRESLAEAFSSSTRSPEHLAFLAEPAVEAIVARHVAAALNEVASRGYDDVVFAICPDLTHTIYDGHLACMAAADAFVVNAARIVRGAIPKPPAEPADPLVRPAGRTPGTT